MTQTKTKSKTNPTPVAIPDVTADSLELFFADARHHPLLTAAEEIELSKRIERGDMAAKDRMINANVRLVISIARKYQGHGLPLADLVQEGMLGLIRAVEKFDWRKGFKFSTYGTLWIRQSIQRGLSNSGRTVRLPVHIDTRARKIARAERELKVRFERDPTIEEIAEATDLPADEVELIRSADQIPASLDKAVGDSDDAAALGDLIASDRPGPAMEALDAARDRDVADAVRRLPDEERKVVHLRFGLGDDEPVALAKAARELDMSADRVKAIEERALDRLSGDASLQSLREAA